MIFSLKKTCQCLCFLFKVVKLRPKLSSPPCFRIQGVPLSVTDEGGGARKSWCIILDGLIVKSGGVSQGGFVIGGATPSSINIIFSMVNISVPTNETRKKPSFRLF